MKIESQSLEDHQVKLTVEVESERFDQAKHQAARKIARKVKIPGFRPGKAPYHMVVRHVGDETITEEGLEILVDDIYPEILKEADIHPYGPGKFDNLASLEPLTLEFTVPLRPEVTLPDYHHIRFPYEAPEVKEEEIDAVIDNVRQRRAIEENVSRPAEVGDRITVRLSALRYSDDQSDKEELIEERPQTIIISEKDELDPEEWPFTSFSRELIGTLPGEKKILVHKFPEDLDLEALRGVNAEFHVEVVEVKSRTLPEVNDEFVKENGDFDSVSAMRKDIHAALEAQALESYNTEYDDKVIDAIIADATIKYPPQLLEEETDEVISRLENRLRNQGLDLDLYLKTRSMDLEGLRQEAQPTAEIRIRRSLLLMEIANQENIEISEEELEKQTTRTVESMSSYLSQTEFNKLTSKNNFPNLVGSIYADLRINRTVLFLRDLASGKQDIPDEAETTIETVDQVESGIDLVDQSQNLPPAEETSTNIEEPGIEE